MNDLSVSKFVEITGEDDKKVLLEQYKLLLDSLNKLNDIREQANHLWIGINGALLGIAAYVRDSESVEGDKKLLFLAVILLLGVVLTSFWLNSLRTMKKNIDTKHKMLIELEKYFPAKVFTLTINKTTGEEENWSTHVSNEIFVPLAFLISYFLFAVFLYAFPQTIAP